MQVYLKSMQNVVLLLAMLAKTCKQTPCHRQSFLEVAGIGDTKGGGTYDRVQVDLGNVALDWRHFRPGRRLQWEAVLTYAFSDT